MIHSADIRTSTGKTNRPIVKLYPLEVTTNDTEPVNTTAVEEQDGRVSVNRPSRRTAAKKATRQISEWTKLLAAPLEDVMK